MLPTSFSARVQFTWCATERVVDLTGGGPPVDKDVKQKKRASGLDLLRPKSLKGRGRASTSAAELSPHMSFSSNSPHAPPLPASGVQIPGIFPAPRSHTLPIPFQAKAQESRRRETYEHPYEKLEAWQIVEERDPKRHGEPRKLPAVLTDLPFHAPLVRSPSAKSPLHEADVERVHWMHGRAEISMLGVGGSGGGDFKVFVDGGSHATINHFLASITLATRPQDFNQFGICVPWDVCDIQLVHPSVFYRHHVLSVRLIGASTTAAHSTAPLATSPSPPSSGRSRRGRPTSASGLQSVFGIRPRGKTITGEPPTSFQVHDRSDSTEQGTEPVSQTHVRQPDSVVDKTVFLCFACDAERKEWFALLRSFCRWRTPDDPRLHRPLAISIFDLAETARNPGRHSGAVADGDKTTEKWSRMSHSETKATTGYAGESVLSRKPRSLKPGWTERDKLALEILLDGAVAARSTWAKASDHGVSPFWGETFALSDLGSFTSCSIVVYRQNKGKTTIVGSVELPLVSDFGRHKDERYPVKSVVDDAVIAEVRMSVSYQEVSVLPVERYRAIELAEVSRIEYLYRLEDLGQLDGAYDGLAKIGLANGVVFDLLSKMADREARTSEKTLFRSNTPLSKLLESTIRLMSQEFLVRSIGPTIARLAMSTSSSGVALPADGTLVHEELDRVSELIEACWADLYAARGALPEPLKACLGALFRAVKLHHPNTTEIYLPYKAISSFIFLRLLSPAIMRPHLFGLRSGLWSSGQQRTATLIAKVISSMSFFSPRDSQRDPELALFGDLIKANADMMLDYLSSFTVESPASVRRSQHVESPVNALIQERIARLPARQAEAVPRPTIAGPIDLQAEAAVLSAMLHARRTPTYVRRAAGLSQPDDQMLDDLDANLTDIHGTPPSREATPPDSSIITPEYQLPLLHSARRPSTPERHSPDDRAFPTPPSPFGLTREKSLRQRRDLTEAAIVRSLSGRGVVRRGSMPRLRIRPAGPEADDRGRPSTARR